MPERRHRIKSTELTPVKQAIEKDLIHRIRERDDLLSTAELFRLWYRIETHCRSKPIYPVHYTWTTLESSYGTVISTRGAPEKPK